VPTLLSPHHTQSKKALQKGVDIFVDSSVEWCDALLADESQLRQADGNAFDTMWKYVVGTNYDLLFGDVPGGSAFVCSTIMGINTEGLFSGAVRENAGKLGENIVKSYSERKADPARFADEESLFKEWCVPAAPAVPLRGGWGRALAPTKTHSLTPPFLLLPLLLLLRRYDISDGSASEEDKEGFLQFMLTMQLAANGNQLTTLRWLVGYVFANPSVLAKVRAEVDELVESGKLFGPNSGDTKLQTLLDMSYTNAAITETVRIHSDIPSKFTFRKTETDLEFDGYVTGLLRPCCCCCYCCCYYYCCARPRLLLHY